MMVIGSFLGFGLVSEMVPSNPWQTLTFGVAAESAQVTCR
jgi:hypothetical protein